MQHFSEIPNYPALIRPPYPEPPQFRRILEPVSVLPLLAHAAPLGRKRPLSATNAPAISKHGPSHNGTPKSREKTAVDNPKTVSRTPHADMTIFSASSANVGNFEKIDRTTSAALMGGANSSSSSLSRRLAAAAPARRTRLTSSFTSYCE